MLIALALAPMATARLRDTGAATAILSGVAFGLASLYTKGATTDFLARPEAALAIRIGANPYVYLLVIANIAGTILLQNSFHRLAGNYRGAAIVGALERGADPGRHHRLRRASAVRARRCGDAHRRIRANSRSQRSPGRLSRLPSCLILPAIYGGGLK